jgi:processive 1,2-diacylglycerol beta-glucosyltransferase
MTTDVVIVYTPVGGGHRAAALALAEAAKGHGLRTEVLDLFESAPAFVGATYQTAHLRGTTLTPNLYGMGYFAANRRDGALDPLRRGFDHVAFAGLVKAVQLLQPRAVVATHHLPLVVLGRARRLGRLAAPLTGVITDYTSHACWAEPGVDAFCVSCPSAARELAAHGVARDAMTVTGIPVRPAFERVADVRAPRDGERLRVLVTSGSFGLGPLEAIVRSFAGVRDVELTVVCGSAKGAEARATRAAAEAGVEARVLGFERDMPARLAEAHVVIGKAGGLTVSETMAAGRPMILVGTVPGNELSNERLVVSNGAGYAGKAGDAGAIASALRARGEIEAMGRNARAVVLAHAAERALAVAWGAGGRGMRSERAA